MRQKIVAGNWKMNGNIAEGIALALELKDKLRGLKPELVVCPPLIALEPIAKILTGTNIKIGAQNAYCEAKGAFTGEVSIPMLKGLVQYLIIGHSERRQIFGEQDDLINKKVKACLDAEIIPILCVGETAVIRKAAEQEKFVTEQLKQDLTGLDKVSKAKVVIAYEPIWAIGTGENASPKQVEEICALIRAQGLSENSVLYGGSVNAGNAATLAELPDLDGFLVGGASLKAEEFAQIAANF